MTILFWGLTLGTVGKILLGIAVVFVHWRVVKEHRIDARVLTEMRRERNVALLAIALITIGYLLEIAHFGYLPLL